MKVLTSRLVDLGKALSKEAQQSQADSLIELGPYTLLTVELPSQLKRLNTPTTDIEVSDSFIWQPADFLVAGVGGGLTFEGPRLVSGVWRLRGAFRCQFTGTTSINNASFARLQQQSSAGAVDFWLGRAFHFNPTSSFQYFDYVISLGGVSDGNTYSLDFVGGTTVALDNLAASVSMIASRLF